MNVLEKKLIAAIGTSTSLPGTNNRKTMFLGPGKWSVAVNPGPTSGFLDLVSNVNIQGAGRDNTIIEVISPRVDSPVGLRGVGLTNIGISDLTIDGGPQRGITQGIYFEGCTNVHIKNVRITRSLIHGITLIYGSSYNLIEDCVIDDTGDPPDIIHPTGIGFGIALFGECHHNEIRQCKVSVADVRGYGGIYIDSSEFADDGGPCNNNIIHHNEVSGFPVGIGIEGSDYNLLSENEIKEWRVNGILLVGGQDNRAPKRNELRNNVIKDAATNNGEAAISLAGAQETDVVKNEIVNAGTNHGIRQTPPITNALIAAPALWEQGTAYGIGDRVANLSNFNIYIAVVAGVSAVAGDGPQGDGTNIVDGTVEWDYQTTHPGRCTRNLISENLIRDVIGSGIFIETGSLTIVSKNKLIDCVAAVLNVDAPIRVQNTSTSSILDLPIDDVVISENEVLGGTAPGILVQTQVGTDPYGAITNIRSSLNQVKNIGAGAGITYACLDAALGPVSSINDNVVDTRDVVDMTGAIVLYNNTGNVIVSRVEALQNQVPSGFDIQYTGGHQAIRDARSAASFVYDPGNIAAGAFALEDNIPVRGAALGDTVVVSHPYGNTADGLISVGTVQEPNYCRLTVFNPTAGAIAPGSATWTIQVLKH